jgi:lipopolysaccharide biosynthesis glycosyltransferase
MSNNFVKNIVLATDNNFVQHCAVTMVSVLMNNTDVHFWLLTEGLKAENEQILTKLVNDHQGKLTFVKVEPAVLQQLPMPQDINLSHISVATYYRLFISSLLPKELIKVLYIDCDIVVRTDISELYQTVMDGYALAAVYQDDPLLTKNEVYARLSFPQEYGYFNAGVILINLEYWRENQIEMQFMHYIKKAFNRISMHDQDVLNAVLYQQTLPLASKWNMLTPFFLRLVYDFSTEKSMAYKDSILKTDRYNPAIVHFVSRPKPWEWECSHPFRKDYFYYLSFTPWKGWKPEVKLSFSAIKGKLRGNSLVKQLIPNRFRGLYL